MPDYAALKAALAATYSGLTDAQIIADVNAATVAQTVDVAMSDVLAYFALQGELPTIKVWATNPPTVSASVTAQAANAAQTLGLMVGPPPLFDSLQMSVPATATAISGMVSALVSAGLLTSTFADSITALGTQNVSQASLWGFPNGVYENDLAAARAMP